MRHQSDPSYVPNHVLAGSELWRAAPEKLAQNRLSAEPSAPAIVNAGFRCFAPLLLKRRIVRVALRASPVISGRVVGVERRAFT